MTARARIAPLLAAALAAAVATGCGLGAGDRSKDPVSLTVTRDFGRTALLRATATDVPESETVMRLLRRRAARVTTRFGGGFVQSIDGLGGGTAGGRAVDWFYFVNGSEAPKGAAATKVRGGDAIWWDRRRWDLAQRVPAVVGSFPEPFLHGPGTARRLPVRLECADPDSTACAVVAERLASLGVPAARGSLRAAIAQDSLRVLVGPWSAVSADDTLLRIEGGPRASGVFASPRDAGAALALLDASGTAVRTLRAGAGLVAATAQDSGPPVWTVTGTDAAGVEAAARAFRAADLRGRYAVAVDRGRVVALPVQGGGA